MSRTDNWRTVTRVMDAVQDEFNETNFYEEETIHEAVCALADAITAVQEKNQS